MINILSDCILVFEQCVISVFLITSILHGKVHIVFVLSKKDNSCCQLICVNAY